MLGQVEAKPKETRAERTAHLTSWKKGETGNKKGKPKGPNLKNALQDALRAGSRDDWIRSMREILRDPDHKHFAATSKLILTYFEGRPVDSTDRTMDKLLARIELIPGRQHVPLPDEEARPQAEVIDSRPLGESAG